MPAPAHLIGSPNPLVSRAPQTQKKGLEQAPGIPTGPRNVSKPCSSFFARSGNSNLSVIKVFFCAKTGPIKLPRKCGGLKSASKNHFQRLVKGPAGLPRLVSRPAALPLPCGAGSASFSRVSRPSVLRTVMESTAPTAAFVGARKAPASSTAFTRRSVRSLLCWNLSALSWRTLNSVARHLQLREVAAGWRGGVPHAEAGQGEAEGALALQARVARHHAGHQPQQAHGRERSGEPGPGAGGLKAPSWKSST